MVHSSNLVTIIQQVAHLSDLKKTPIVRKDLNGFFIIIDSVPHFIPKFQFKMFVSRCFRAAGISEAIELDNEETIFKLYWKYFSESLRGITVKK